MALKTWQEIRDARAARSTLDLKRASLARLRDGVRRLPREARWIVQRARHGYSEADAWSIYQHVSAILAGALAQMGAEPRGCPADFVDGYDGDLVAASEAWARMLREAAHGFDLIARDEQFESVENTIAARRAIHIMSMHFYDLWD